MLKEDQGNHISPGELWEENNVWHTTSDQILSVEGSGYSWVIQA